MPVSTFPSVQSHFKAFGIGIALAIAAIGAYVQWGPGAGSATPTVTVYKSPTCGCCSEWVTHLRDNGFSVKVQDEINVRPIKARLGVPRPLSSCHTAVVGEYVVEGHVPAGDIKRLLRERPSFHGLSVPGMPVGSPGMEQGNYVEPYAVVGFTPQGDTTHVARYGPRQ